MARFQDLLTDGRIHFFDGGYGTLLMQRGLPAGASPEVWGLANPDVVAQVHRDYLDAGAELLTTNTFGGSRPKLPGSVSVAEVNRAMCALARRIAGDRACVAASIGPTGLFVRPLGELSFRELVDIFKEQIRACVEGGADLIMGETHFDLAEAKAVVVAAHEVCDLPVGISMTFEPGADGGRCLTGTAPAAFIAAMQNLGADVVATNCSAGPEQIARAVAAMAATLDAPLYVSANAGLPELGPDGKTVFRLGPEAFATQSKVFAGLGAKFIGGCCGTGPDHIRALTTALAGAQWTRPAPERPADVRLVSRTALVGLGGLEPCAVIGERINPTGKALLADQLRAGVFTEAVRLAEEQIAHGATVLDVNVGAPMVDEKAVLPALAETLAGRLDAPLCLDSSDPEAMALALEAMPGSPLVNSISGEPGRMEILGPLCRKLGAPFILLPLAGKKLPVTAAERIAILEGLLKKAYDLGIPKRLILVDALALTVSSKPEAARACLEFIRWCRREHGLPTTLGLSNISFGLPARELLNASFLAMCQGAGLSACIANPASVRLREALAAGEALLGRDRQAQAFLDGYGGWTSAPQGGAPAGPAPAAPGAAGKDADGDDPLARAVLQGDARNIEALVQAALDGGAEAFALVNDRLIPAIMTVGERYERKEVFLPRLIASAEALQRALAILEPLLQRDEGGRRRDVVIMATVQGDIHDIGKNIVCLMLKNHGFEVRDLGKDVPAEAIVAAAKEHGAALIGLSALMTTTMVRMEDTIRLVREQGLPCRVMLGGAVVTEAFAQAVGADGFALDAVAAVKLAKRLVQ